MDEKPTDADRLRRRYDRERKARIEAEDIAERVTAQLYSMSQQLARANEVLEGANKSIRDFVSVASHDLRGPITAIIGFGSLMLQRWNETSDDDRRKFVEVIERQAGHLARLVDDLLVVSRIETGDVEAHVEEVLVGRFLEQTVEQFVQDGSEIRVSCRPKDLKVLADPDHLHRILSNYLSNALKYGKPPIEAQALAAGEWVELRVRDHGEGIPQDLVPRLFEKFTRSHAGRGQEKGTGLGLSIVRGLALANGGEAWYEPNEKGTCFAVRLPSPARAA